jgi:hypothetical protein
MNKKFKYQLVPINIMAETTQINVRMEDNFLNKAKTYAQEHGFGNVQELMKETLREKLFPVELTKEELLLVKKLAQVTEKNNLWGTEEELFNKLKR